MKLWGLVNDDQCECGQTQSMENLFNCPLAPARCARSDLALPTHDAIQCAKFWETSFKKLRHNDDEE